MSAISALVRPALYLKLNVTDVTSLATGGVHYRVAPSKTVNGSRIVSVNFPLVVFDRIPGSVDYAFAGNIVGERDLWMIRAHVDEDSDATKSPAELAEEILAACETAIGGTLDIPGKTVSCARRRGDIPLLTDDQSDRQVWMEGFYLDVYAG
jgi:hypothetical protein